ncbi:MAG: hypothetical protein NC206_03595 [Bacteroides sp.]|nr:hypothetical protein [Roseburia sp.]MCM1346150.1 hypothetical protein [Bacteroides sp.]MCM1439892.1 hypothetical protein [Roseburia sp.]
MINIKKKIGYISLFIIACIIFIFQNIPLRTALFRSIAKGSIYMISERDTLYVFGYSGVQKWLTTDPDKMVLLTENDEFCHNTFIGHLVARSGVVNGDYLYVACRSYLGGTDTCDDKDYVNGKLLILRKSDLGIVREYKSDIKLIETKIKDDLLVVSGLYGFNIYRIKNPDCLSLLFDYRQKEFTEFQGLEIFEKQDSLYIAFAKFTEGISIWNITCADKPYEAYKIPLQIDKSKKNNQYAVLQCFRVKYKEPYLYATVAPILESFLTPNDFRGILTLNTDSLPNLLTTFSRIPTSDYYKTRIGDPEPSHIDIYGDSIYTNFGEKGVAIFDISNPGIPIYEGVKDIGNNGNMILPLHINNSGVVLTGDYYWSDIYNCKIK